MNKSSYAKLLLGVCVLSVLSLSGKIGTERISRNLRESSFMRAYYNSSANKLIENTKGLLVGLTASTAGYAAYKEGYGIAGAVVGGIASASSILLFPSYLLQSTVQKFSKWIPFTNSWKASSYLSRSENESRRFVRSGDITRKDIDSCSLRPGIVHTEEDLAFIGELNVLAQRREAQGNRPTLFQRLKRVLRNCMSFMQYNAEGNAVQQPGADEPFIGKSVLINKVPDYVGNFPHAINQLIHHISNPDEHAELLRDPDPEAAQQNYLLFGPPGTGKSTLARAVAYYTGLPILFYKGSEFVNMYVGVGAANVRAMFEETDEIVQEMGNLSDERKIELVQRRNNKIDEFIDFIRNLNPVVEQDGAQNGNEQNQQQVDEIEVPQQVENQGENAPVQAQQENGAANGNLPQRAQPAERQLSIDEVRQLIAQTPVILFVDEIDTLAGKRTQGAASGGSQEYNQTLTDFLTSLEGAEGRRNVTVIGATNMPAGHFDDAFLSRFMQVEVPAPDAENQRMIIDYYLAKYRDVAPEATNAAHNLTTPQNENDVTSAQIYGWTGRKIRNLIRSAANFTVNRGSRQINQDDINNAYRLLLHGEQRAQGHRYDNVQRQDGNEQVPNQQPRAQENQPESQQNADVNPPANENNQVPVQQQQRPNNITELLQDLTRSSREQARVSQQQTQLLRRFMSSNQNVRQNRLRVRMPRVRRRPTVQNVSVNS